MLADGRPTSEVARALTFPTGTSVEENEWRGWTDLYIDRPNILIVGSERAAEAKLQRLKEALDAEPLSARLFLSGSLVDTMTPHGGVPRSSDKSASRTAGSIGLRRNFAPDCRASASSTASGNPVVTIAGMGRGLIAIS